eukprot:115435_1
MVDLIWSLLSILTFFLREYVASTINVNETTFTLPLGFYHHQMQSFIFMGNVLSILIPKQPVLSYPLMYYKLLNLSNIIGIISVYLNNLYLYLASVVLISIGIVLCSCTLCRSNSQNIIVLNLTLSYGLCSIFNACISLNNQIFEQHLMYSHTVLMCMTWFYLVAEYYAYLFGIHDLLNINKVILPHFHMIHLISQSNMSYECKTLCILSCVSMICYKIYKIYTCTSKLTIDADAHQETLAQITKIANRYTWLFCTYISFISFGISMIYSIFGVFYEAMMISEVHLIPLLFQFSNSLMLMYIVMKMCNLYRSWNAHSMDVCLSNAMDVFILHLQYARIPFVIWTASLFDTVYYHKETYIDSFSPYINLSGSYVVLAIQYVIILVHCWFVYYVLYWQNISQIARIAYGEKVQENAHKNFNWGFLHGAYVDVSLWVLCQYKLNSNDTISHFNSFFNLFFFYKITKDHYGMLYQKWISLKSFIVSGLY